MKKKDLLNNLNLLQGDLSELISNVENLVSSLDGDDEIEQDFENEKIEELKEEIEKLEDINSELEEDIRTKNSIISSQEEENSHLLEEITEYETGNKITSELIIKWFESPFISDFDKQRVKDVIINKLKLSA